MEVNTQQEDGAGPDVPARRLTPRVPAVHTAALRIRNDEILGKTCDLSPGGIGLVVTKTDASPGDPIDVDILFDNVLKRFRGHVAFVLHQAKAARLGVQFRS